LGTKSEFKHWISQVVAKLPKLVMCGKRYKYNKLVIVLTGNTVAWKKDFDADMRGHKVSLFHTGHLTMMPVRCSGKPNAQEVFAAVDMGGLTNFQPGSTSWGEPMSSKFVVSRQCTIDGEPVDMAVFTQRLMHEFDRIKGSDGIQTSQDAKLLERMHKCIVSMQALVEEEDAEEITLKFAFKANHPHATSTWVIPAHTVHEITGSYLTKTFRGGLDYCIYESPTYDTDMFLAVDVNDHDQAVGKFTPNINLSNVEYEYTVDGRAAVTTGVLQGKPSGIHLCMPVEVPRRYQCLLEIREGTKLNEWTKHTRNWTDIESLDPLSLGNAATTVVEGGRPNTTGTRGALLCGDGDGGVRVDANGALVSIELNGSGINGQLACQFSGCEELRVLDLGKNKLQGFVPWKRLGELVEQHSLHSLNLGENEFVVSLASEHKTNFNTLSSSGSGGSSSNGNSLDALPFESLACGLCTLGLRKLGYTGSMPAGFGNLVTLVELDLCRNSLSGAVPSFSRCVNLTSLKLHKNTLSGGIGDLFSPGTNTKLAYVDLSSNSFQGEIPWETFSALANDHRLRALYLGANEFSVDEIPDLTYGMTKLTALGLHRLGYHGSVKRGFEQFKALTVLDLRNNHFQDPDEFLPIALLQRQQLELGLSGNRFKVQNLYTEGEVRRWGETFSNTGPAMASFCGKECWHWKSMIGVWMQKSRSQCCVFLQDYDVANQRDSAPPEWHGKRCKEWGKYYGMAARETTSGVVKVVGGDFKGRVGKVVSFDDDTKWVLSVSETERALAEKEKDGGGGGGSGGGGSSSSSSSSKGALSYQLQPSMDYEVVLFESGEDAATTVCIDGAMLCFINSVWSHQQYGCGWFEKWCTNIDKVLADGCTELVVYADSSGHPDAESYTPGSLGCCQTVENKYLEEKAGVDATTLPEMMYVTKWGNRMVSARVFKGTNGISIIRRDLGVSSKGEFNVGFFSSSSGKSNVVDLSARKSNLGAAWSTMGDEGQWDGADLI
jgi:hypothetical protein